MSKKAVVKHKEEPKIIKSNELSRLLKIILVVTIIFGAFYGLTYVLKGDPEYKYENPNEDTISTIQYKEILAGTLLNQNANEYYVIAYAKDEVYFSLYNKYVESYIELKKLPVYIIDLSDGYNKKYASTKSNFKFEDVKDLRFKQTTLLKIENNKIKEVYEKQADIEKQLKELTKTK